MRYPELNYRVFLPTEKCFIENSQIKTNKKIDILLHIPFKTTRLLLDIDCFGWWRCHS